MSCNGFVKDRNASVFLRCCIRLVSYYLSNVFVVPGKSDALRDIPKLINRLINSEDLHLNCWVSQSIVIPYYLESVALLSLIRSLDYLLILWGALIAASCCHFDQRMWVRILSVWRTPYVLCPWLSRYLPNVVYSCIPTGTRINSRSKVIIIHSSGYISNTKSAHAEWDIGTKTCMYCKVLLSIFPFVGPRMDLMICYYRCFMCRILGSLIIAPFIRFQVWIHWSYFRKRKLYI